MKLDTEFYKLPLRFDAARLAEEVLQFDESEWRPHPQAHVGNTAIPLISVGGGMNDEMRGPMKPTPFLERCPYLQQILASIGSVIGRARLMRIAGESDANAHVDASYYWRHHVRVHVPAVTYPEVQFLCGDKAVNMAAGEAWIFDSWKLHNVINPRTTPRIHFVADTVGSGYFWDSLVARAQRPFAASVDGEWEPEFVPYVPGKQPSFALEKRNFPVVMTPWEQECLGDRIFNDLDPGAVADARPLLERTRALHREWMALWTQHGESSEGWEPFQTVLGEYKEELARWVGRYSLLNGMDLAEALRHSIVSPALTPELAAIGSGPGISNGNGARAHSISAPEVKQVEVEPNRLSDSEAALRQPVFIIAAPRSGSTMLFELLARSPGFSTVGGESHKLIESVGCLSPAKRDFESNSLTALDATAETVRELRAHFLENLRTSDGGEVPADATVRMLEKTPKNALRIPFLRAAFPDARFIYLYRDPEENISSILDAWRSGRFVTYPNLPGWSGPQWSLALIPGWRDLAGKELAEVAARQWTDINARIIADLEAIPREEWCSISYAEILKDPQAAAVRLCRFAGVPWPEEINGPLPQSRYTLTPPEPGKWRKNEAEMRPFLPISKPVAQIAQALLNGSQQQEQMSAAPVELTSVHTSNFPGLLTQLGISLLVTTYQAGRLIILREQGGILNTHFRTFRSPMGLAYDGLRLAIGTKREVWEFVNQADVSPRLDPPNTHDAAFLPRRCHNTGDIRVHEMAYAGMELWAVNTRFSCLCSFDSEHSFVPRWRPPFVSALAPEDRCHLNGMALVGDAVKYVTCLGISDQPGGWRENKARGGCILEVPGGEIITRGLSMPHSPRMYGGHLWVLESGEGTLLRIDPKTGASQEVARMPGFTRGMDFFGPYAFIGLSQVRETAVFSGLPLTERLSEGERSCGVWVVDLRSGKTAAFLQFETGVQEIFAIQVLPEIRHPDVITDDDEILSSSFVLPETSLMDVPAALLPANAPETAVV